MNLFKRMTSIFVLLAAFVAIPSVMAATPEVRDDGVTVIHLDQHGGHFAAEETLASLKSGVYEFVITNKTNKLVGFQIQNFTTHEGLDMFPLEPGQTGISRVTVTEEGVRFRCPINPTPWYDLDNIN